MGAAIPYHAAALRTPTGSLGLGAPAGGVVPTHRGTTPQFASLAETRRAFAREPRVRVPVPGMEPHL